MDTDKNGIQMESLTHHIVNFRRNANRGVRPQQSVSIGVHPWFQMNRSGRRRGDRVR
jgi:hypothetical protein